MTRPILVLCLLLSGLTGQVFAGSDFDRMKTLVGEWEASSPEGKFKTTFQLVSNGTALMETMDAGGDNMVTLYHPDGESTLMTHYCSSGNQPRLRAKPGRGDTIAFEFVDVSNPSVGNHGVMSRLVIKFQDATNMIAEWTSKEKGKESTAVFHLRRVK